MERAGASHRAWGGPDTHKAGPGGRTHFSPGDSGGYNQTAHMTQPTFWRGPGPLLLLLAGVAALLPSTASASADESRALLRRADELQENMEFEQALAAYEKVLLD